jgi:hypothetical protein
VAASLTGDFTAIGVVARTNPMNISTAPTNSVT